MSLNLPSLYRIILAAKKDEAEDDDDGDLNEFNPRRNKTEQGNTPSQVKEKLKKLNVMFKVGPDEYFVWLKGTKQDDGYSTTDLDDALATGTEMAKSKKKN